MPNDPYFSDVSRLASSVAADTITDCGTVSEGTCWLVSLPYPDNADKPEGRHWYHILLDSWIWGEVGEYGGWVVGQRFHGPAKYNSIEEIQDICREVEKISHATSGEL